ncbi:cbb3-type cytochrome c oxidase subunit 3 [Parahaliea sp. F7430]|uniref:Cbb3-type cytochrome c oxidase subunit 3 n=1 Tax=Sediminihaliea albiluteola TaxID=2758564 RepID=A0A7W2TV69_9GAMM|nr:cbb3-type cytochrome c oxidase subunit 3 [Sediminihaliea albiluteola]MBA6412561.1 cbb3-type cytochrome c oxidase subunit 3 [Sediminihaliea albiluteola]
MDINDLRGLSTLFLMLSFIGLCIWAYSGKQRESFNQAAQLPFADDEMNKRSMREEVSND